MKTCDKHRFYICKHCGNIIGMIECSGVHVVCCGEEMTLLEPNTSDGAHEKHVPIVTVEGNKITVKIGSAPHPMLAEHHISWVYLQTEKGGQRKNLEIGTEPQVSFLITEDDKPLAAYAYCNLHGLWEAPIE